MNEINQHNDADISRQPAAPAKAFSAWKVLLPVLIGLTVVVLMFIHDAKKENVIDILRSIDFTPYTIGMIALAWLFMLGRDFGLSWRFRELTGKQLRWSQAIKVDFMCEFTSCITPSSVGGSSLGMFFLNSEGIEIGRATTLMFTTLFLDELFFVVACPVLLLFTPAGEVFAATGDAFSKGIELTFWLIYCGITIWTFILFVGLLIKPHAISRFLTALFSIKLLRRWRPAVAALGDNMVATSADLKTKSFIFWVKNFVATMLSWTSRFLVVNALFLAFIPGTLSDQWLILVRQFVVWVVLTVSPTPGGSGLSEWLFTEYYGNLIPTAGLALIMAIFWRLISYYVYLIVGACIAPSWVKNAVERLRNARVNHKNQQS